MKHVKNLIVGAGLSGITLANGLAQKGEDVLVVETRAQIGGNCYDYYDKNGICIHQYGPHIFRTNDKKVWDYLGRFTKWRPYMHKVKGFVDGQEVPIPFNLDSIEQIFPAELAARLTNKLLEQFGFNVKVSILQLRSSKDKDLAFLADYIYDKVFLHYTLKQWGLSPEDLDESVTSRVPVYISRDGRYFQDKYQGMPDKGYTALMQNMLKDSHIEVQLNTSFADVKDKISWDRLFYTGPIDEFFDYKYGALPYRSLYFDFVEYDQEYFQSAAVINYPCNYDFTRISEYKYFLNDKSPKTVVSYEYSQAFKRGENEPYYPIIRPENQALYAKYLKEASQQPGVYFLGRLGDYKYYNMTDAVSRALNLLDALYEPYPTK